MQIGWLKQLLAVDSQNAKSNKNCALLVSKIVRSLGGKVSLKKYSSGNIDRWNVIAKWNFSSSKKPLVFSGHTDTANRTQGWKTNPFLPTQKSGKLFGLGASDMKGSIAAFLGAVQQANISRPIVMLLDGDEESDAIGGKMFLKLGIRNATVIVGEPSNCKLRLGHKACFDMAISVQGVSGHGSRTSFTKNSRDNAIIRMQAIISALRSYEKKIDKKIDPIFGRSTLSYGLISGGTSSNTIADTSRLIINRRLIPEESIDREIRQMQSIIKKIDPKAISRIVFYGGSYFVDQKTAWVQNIQKKLSKKKIFLSIMYGLGWTEASLFADWGKVLIFGPGNLSTIHKSNEYITIKDFEKTEKVYKAFCEDDSL